VSYQGILIAFFLGSAIGVPLAYLMPMTAVPQRTALSHAFGALAARTRGNRRVLQALAARFCHGGAGHRDAPRFLTFTGSLMAFGKLQELLPGRPITYRNQNLINLSILGLAILFGVMLVLHPERTWMFPIFAALALLFGVLLIVPIGGADMPTVIALLNFLRRVVGRGDGVRAGQQVAGDRRDAGWLLGAHSVRSSCAAP